jgi:hypothetical protein
VLPLAILLGVLALIAIAALLRKSAPPEAARLLPESDAIVYLQLSTLRSATHWDSSPIARSADFQRFIDATGIVPERDIDSAAFALHHMADPRGPNGAVAYSEVFTGRFDGVKLAGYLAGIATAKESYAGHDVYSVPIEGRTLRIAQMGYDSIAASNMPTAEQIHSMLDRHRAAGLWQPGSSLLAARYREVPLLSQAWAIGHIGLPFAERGHIALLGMELPLAEDTDLVASLRYSGAVHLRVEEIAPDEDNAARTVKAMSGLLDFLRSVQDAQPAVTPAAQAMRAVVGTIAIEQHHDRAVLTASATTDELRALAAGEPAAPSGSATPASPQASK